MEVCGRDQLFTRELHVPLESRRRVLGALAALHFEIDIDLARMRVVSELRLSARMVVAVALEELLYSVHTLGYFLRRLEFAKVQPARVRQLPRIRRPFYTTPYCHASHEPAILGVET